MPFVVKNDTLILHNEEDNLPLPVAAIIALSFGGYVAIIVIALLIRKCLISQGFCRGCCPMPVLCDCCSCCRSCAESCNCRLPSIDNCLDFVCPAKQRLNCVEFLVCEWASFTLCQRGGTYTCGSGDCACTCESPHCDSINCLCCEISFRNVSSA